MAVDEGELWENGRKYIELVGKIPSTFSFTVRGLKANQIKNTDQGTLGFSPEMKFQLGRILRSKAVLAPFYYATKAFYPDKIGDVSTITGARIMEFYNPVQAANMLTTIFYARRLKKLCAPEPWAWIEKRVQEYLDLGVRLGRAVPSIGITEPLIVAPIRHLALTPFILRDNKQFQAYKLHLKKKRKQFDLAEEVNLFGSTHIHLASLMLQQIGYGIEYADALNRALISNPKEKISNEASKIRIVASYIEALYGETEPPALVDESEYDIKESSIDILIEEAERIREGGSPLPWLSKTKEDLDGTATPALLAETDADDESEVLEGN